MLLGIDIGTTNIKVIAYDPSGSIAAIASVVTPAYSPQPGWVEHDADIMWHAVVTAIRQVLHRVDARQILAVAVASVGESGVLLDAQGRALAPIIAWHDERTVPIFSSWLEQHGQRLACEIAGMPAKPIYSLFKLMWLREHYSEAYAAATRFLCVSDYIAFRLSGVQASDYSMASRTLLFDLYHRRWSSALLDSGGIRHALMPELVPAGQAIGALTPQAAGETGLISGTIVAAGGHDHIVGALAAGVTHAGQCLDSLGTAEAVFMPLDATPAPEIPMQSGCIVGAHVARDRLYALEGLWSGGGSVAWVRDILTPHTQGFSALEQLAAEAVPASMGVIFVPRLSGGQRGSFVGLSMASSRADMARAVYEGLAFEWRRYLELLEGAFGVHADHIRLTGGGSRSQIWVQIKAAVLGRPLHVLELEESVALGAALLAGLACGTFATEEAAIRSVPVRERIVTPDLALCDLYEHCYREGYLRVSR